MKIELAGDQATIVLDALNLWLYEHQPVTPENQVRVTKIMNSIFFNKEPHCQGGELE